MQNQFASKAPFSKAAQREKRKKRDIDARLALYSKRIVREETGLEWAAAGSLGVAIAFQQIVEEAPVRIAHSARRIQLLLAGVTWRTLLVLTMNRRGFPTVQYL